MKVLILLGLLVGCGSDHDYNYQVAWFESVTREQVTIEVPFNPGTPDVVDKIMTARYILHHQYGLDYADSGILGPVGSATEITHDWADLMIELIDLTVISY